MESYHFVQCSPNMPVYFYLQRFIKHIDKFVLKWKETSLDNYWITWITWIVLFHLYIIKLRYFFHKLCIQLKINKTKTFKTPRCLFLRLLIYKHLFLIEKNPIQCTIPTYWCPIRTWFLKFFFGPSLLRNLIKDIDITKYKFSLYLQC